MSSFAPSGLGTQGADGVPHRTRSVSRFADTPPAGVAARADRLLDLARAALTAKIRDGLGEPWPALRELEAAGKLLPGLLVEVLAAAVASGPEPAEKPIDLWTHGRRPDDDDGTDADEDPR